MAEYEKIPSSKFLERYSKLRDNIVIFICWFLHPGNDIPLLWKCHSCALTYKGPIKQPPKQPLQVMKSG